MSIHENQILSPADLLFDAELLRSVRDWPFADAVGVCFGAACWGITD